MIKVLHPGFYTTVQDLGRFGYQQYGVPVSGAMDSKASRLANAIVGNDRHEAVLEITMSGPKLEFSCDTTIAITGADISPLLNGFSVKLNMSIPVKTGDVLTFGKLISGFRCYLAVAGGIQVPKIMDSRSMYKGITDGHILKKEDMLAINSGQIKQTNTHAIVAPGNYMEDQILKVYEGPEFDWLPEADKKKLLNSEFTISKYHSRMAYQLEEPIPNNMRSLLTSLVLPGTVQLTPSGTLIVLMRDCQTTGGYPRVLQLEESSIDTLAQKITGNRIMLKKLQ